MINVKYRSACRVKLVSILILIASALVIAIYGGEVATEPITPAEVYARACDEVSTPWSEPTPIPDNLIQARISE